MNTSVSSPSDARAYPAVFLRCRTIGFGAISFFSFLWIIFLCVVVFMNWDAVDRPQQVFMAVMIITHTLTIIMYIILIVKPFRPWLDAARCFLGLITHASIAGAYAYWSPRFRCRQAKTDGGLCFTRIAFTVATSWLIPTLLAVYAVCLGVMLQRTKQQEKAELAAKFDVEKRGTIPFSLDLKTDFPTPPSSVLDIPVMDSDSEKSPLPSHPMFRPATVSYPSLDMSPSVVTRHYSTYPMQTGSPQDSSPLVSKHYSTMPMNTRSLTFPPLDMSPTVAHRDYSTLPMHSKALPPPPASPPLAFSPAVASQHHSALPTQARRSLPATTREPAPLPDDLRARVLAHTRHHSYSSNVRQPSQTGVSQHLVSTLPNVRPPPQVDVPERMTSTLPNLRRATHMHSRRPSHPPVAFANNQRNTLQLPPVRPLSISPATKRKPAPLVIDDSAYASHQRNLHYSTLFQQPPRTPVKPTVQLVQVTSPVATQSVTPPLVPLDEKHLNQEYSPVSQYSQTSLEYLKESPIPSPSQRSPRRLSKPSPASKRPSL